MMHSTSARRCLSARRRPGHLLGGHSCSVKAVAGQGRAVERRWRVEERRCRTIILFVRCPMNSCAAGPDAPAASGFGLPRAGWVSTSLLERLRNAV